MPTRLGQNFLRDEKVLKKIIESANLQPDDFVIEIGPGEGVLTEELAKRAKPASTRGDRSSTRGGKVIAIEIDKVLSNLLRNKFSNNKNVEIINTDVLKINLPRLLGHPMSKYKVVANLPYYITSPILRLFLEADCPPQEMILMVQKEVAERIVASPSEIPAESRGAKRISRGRPGKMSILSVSVQYYAKPELLFYVSKNSFHPVPEVDSAVIRIVHIANRGAQTEEEVKNFFRVVRAGFSAKRKVLVNNLANSLHLDKKVVEGKIKKIGLNPKVRAQELSVDDWKKLAGIFK